MIVLWVTLLVLHRGYALGLVTTAQLGEPATFICPLPDDQLSRRKVIWYKQRVGDTLKVIVTLGSPNPNPKYSPEYSESSLEVNTDNKFSNLTILRTKQEDEGMYHCAVMEWISDTIWHGTYLLLKENTQRTSNYTVVQSPTVSDRVRPGDSMTLQCSVLSDSEDKTCSGDHSVFWFRSDKSHPNIIYTDGNRHDGCEQRSDTQKSCVYRFSKNVSSSDAGTYYCAVATCGEILFGNGTKLDVEERGSQTANALFLPLCAVLAISLIALAFFIYATKCDGYNAAVVLQKNSGGQKSQQKDKNMCVYSAVVFTVMKSDRGAKASDRERIYAAVKAFGLD